MNNLPQQHPVRVLIESAATGRIPTAKDLDRLDQADVPEGESLATYRATVDSAARRVAAIGATGDHVGAQREAHNGWGTIAARMTPDQRAIDTSDPNPASLDDIARSIFTN